ncbi:MAG TPA: hypothetical protein RMH99_17005 [Sandaracinaceae bacterium LLY-WYZ-13_1]|nr:hypothetical protein [Sandaracinaceae bacterium LLY-WYZ-13_1]
MTVRDLGYRAYEGELLPSSHNSWVLLRYGLWRIWGSWVNKIVVFFFWFPCVVYVGLALFRYFIVGPEMPPEAVEEGGWFAGPPGEWMRYLTAAQFWFFAIPVTLRSGAGIVAGDLSHKAYQFYFAKPVTAVQYLIGRAAALALFLFGLIFVPTLILALVFVGTGPEDQMLERLGLLLPAFLDALVIATSLSVLAVGVSAISKSRALTLTAWVVLLVVPFALGMLVEQIGEVEWMHAISVPGLLWSLGDGLYKVHDSWEQLKWFHAAPLLLALCAGAGYFAYVRISRAEVIT